MSTKKKPGRRALPRAEKRSGAVMSRFTPSVKRDIERIARRHRRAIGWVVARMVEEALRVGVDAVSL